MSQNERHFRLLLRPVALLLISAVSLVASSSIAQEIPASAPLSVPLEQATDIKAQPLSLLAKFPTAGPALARYVAQALAKEPAAVDAVLSILPDTTPAQASAIGAGMVRAIRALSGKSKDIVSSYTYKVMQSENKWLKTTFSAIGPHGGGKLSTGGSIGSRESDMRRTANNAGGGGAVGSTLADDEGRVGPSVVTNLDGFWAMERESDGFESQLNANLTRYGMIVALIKSDGPSNGVVSISP